MTARSLGYETIRSSLPEWALEAAPYVTHLGDYPVVVAVAIVTWVGLERGALDSSRRGPWPVVAVLGAIGLATVLKGLFGLPRPPGAGIGGYGFPSGHALGSTVAYGAIALSIRSRAAALTAGTIVAIVATSRVAMGVHYPIDVVAGIALGAAFLAVVAVARPLRLETTADTTQSTHEQQ